MAGVPGSSRMHQDDPKFQEWAEYILNEAAYFHELDLYSKYVDYLESKHGTQSEESTSDSKEEVIVDK